eukprot:gnl/MRDRNA2_/MRDRNA2_80558_c0_seq1.p1 gnl/MRDRNA2_/MRDRNA2_80558_c0~~gnl/MRDRNA2_/MRDRNA2_80558_c0_seq1.p1  ORF type:complete len:591 (-),score=85.35 gnl/MRDRNA2_/MRDRNA2_80558_c0_seq1:646-2418(-)
MGGGSYISIVRIAIFFLAVWFGTKSSQKLGISTIVGEILVGVILGPGVGGLIPKEYAECSYDRNMDCDLLKNGGWYHLKGHEDLEHVVDKAKETCAEVDMLEKHGSQEECFIAECKKERLHHCSVSPDIFTLIGHIGVSMMIFEAGMHVDFEKVKLVGAKACCVAVLGTGLPIILGTLLIGAMGYDFYPNGLAVGIALSPTSIGISLKLLDELGVLDRFFGQAIIVAAVVDDVLAIIAFCLFFALAVSSGSLGISISLLACGVCLMMIGSYLALRYWPKWMERILQPYEDQEAKRDALHAFIMWMVFLAYASTFHFLLSHLAGCFIGGMSFTSVPRSHHLWVGQTKPFTTWMLRVFFACTVGFAIPVDQLLTISGFLKGMVIGAIPCLGAKVFCAPFMGDARWVIGWGMCGRAEFAYLIAQMALSSMLMTKEVFSICIWSLLWATLVAPLVFRAVLNKYTKKLKAESEVPRTMTAACGIDGGPRIFEVSEKVIQDELSHMERDQLEETVRSLQNMMKELQLQHSASPEKPKDSPQILNLDNGDDLCSPWVRQASKDRRPSKESITDSKAGIQIVPGCPIHPIVEPTNVPQ